MPDGRFTQWAQRTLGGVTLFAGVATDTVMALGESARWANHPPGEPLIHCGETRDTFFAIVEGSTRLLFEDERAGLVSEAGATVGLRIAFYDGPSWASVRTLTPTLVAEIHRDDLVHAMALSPALATNVGRMLATRNYHVEPRERLDTQILKALRHAVGAPAGTSGKAALREPINPAVWATLLGVDRSDVERALVRLERDRVVHRLPDGTLSVDLERLNQRLD